MKHLETERVSPYYTNSGRIPFASHISLAARKQIYGLFERFAKPTESTRVLDVGVTSDATFRESNFFERCYPYPQNITCVGTEDGRHLEQAFPGIRFLQVTPRAPLPFRDGEFDVVFSNAVVEHTGSSDDQRQFIREMCRVGRSFFVATPNRWFPIEHHTGLPLLHYLPAWMFRALLRRTRYAFWSYESHLNILTASDFRDLFPANVSPRLAKVRVLRLASNLVAFGTRSTNDSTG
jgi:SAM-dependent methyltransferase